MARYRVFVSDSSTGLLKAELPYSGLSFNRALSACGQGTFSLPVDHPKVTEDNLGQLRSSSDREITVWRDNVPVINGPLTGTEASRSSGTVQVTFREASWYFTKRVLEEDKDYDGFDLFDIVRDLDDYMENKTGTGDDGMTLGDNIIAALPRFAIDTATAGVTFTDSSPPTLYGSARHTIADCIDAFAADPDTGGFEWRFDYRTGSTAQDVHRKMMLGTPHIGTTLAVQLSERVLVDFSRTCDWERGATRTHVIGATFTKTLQSLTAVSNSILLTEKVDDATDLTKDDFVTARAKDLRRLSRPPVRVFTATFRPDPKSLAYDFCDLGDTVPFQITTPNILSISSNVRRVVDIATTVDDDGDELVTLTFNDRLEDSGS